MLKILRLARPQFLIASLTLYTMGAFLAILNGAEFSWVRLLLGYLIIMPAHLSVSFSNDYFDIEVDQYGDPSFFSGGSGMLVLHPELRSFALRVAILLNTLSLILGVIFLWQYAYPFWFLGFVLVSNLIGWIYSAPPFRLAYRGLGEWMTALTAGFILPGMGYLAVRGTIDPDGWLLSLPLTLYGLAFILCVEIPDMETDRMGHKYTWVARRGRQFGFSAAAILSLAATLSYFSIATLQVTRSSAEFLLLGLISLLPCAVSLLGLVLRPAGRVQATRLVNAIIVSIAVFYVLSDVYLVAVTVL
jgi:1,4-dihydroxy-2-naphthoate polyprenyltransferase